MSKVTITKEALSEEIKVSVDGITRSVGSTARLGDIAAGWINTHHVSVVSREEHEALRQALYDSLEILADERVPMDVRKAAIKALRHVQSLKAK